MLPPTTGSSSPGGGASTSKNLLGNKKNPELGKFMMLHHPTVKLPTCMGVRMETDKRWVDFLNAWVDYNRGIEQIRQWLYDGLAINGVKPEDIPADVEL